jgi:integrase
MKRLCDEAHLDIEGEYLKPHGGRRSIGSEVYETDAELAQELLRHESIETTHQSYREQNVIERRERLENILKFDG